MATIFVQADGVYIADEGREVNIGGVPVVNGDGSVTIRWAAAQVVSRAALDYKRCIDLNPSNIETIKLLVAKCGVPLAQIQALRPDVYALLVNAGIVTGTVA
jgi:hypothetical protein